jgi:hypothetical protein
MKPGLTLSSALLAAFLVAPLAAWADANPDFEDDAKPILKMQPGLLRYVESRFDVKDAGTAKYPGDDDRRPAPPYIFRARPIGSNGPFNLRLLIQPGPPGHILGVVDMTKVHLGNPGGPEVASRPPAEAQPDQPPRDQPFEPAPAQEPAPAPPAVQVPELSAGPVEQQPPQQPTGTGPVQPTTPSQPAQPPTQPTADTPSGPIMNSNDPGSSNSGQPSLAPPPDPAPTGQ